MKYLFLPMFWAVASVSFGQNADTIKPNTSHQAIAGYAVNNLGKSGHLLYAYQKDQNVFYGGLRFQEDAFHNVADPSNYEIYGHDRDGRILGFIAGYQRNFQWSNSAITPLATVDLEYAYLDSREKTGSYDPITGTVDYDAYYAVPARNLWLPSLNLGFEARIYKGLFMKQIFGVTALFDDKIKGYGRSGPLTTFNGMGFNIRMSLLHKF